MGPIRNRRMPEGRWTGFPGKARPQPARALVESHPRRRSQTTPSASDPGSICDLLPGRGARRRSPWEGQIRQLPSGPSTSASVVGLPVGPDRGEYRGASIPLLVRLAAAHVCQHRPCRSPLPPVAAGTKEGGRMPPSHSLDLATGSWLAAWRPAPPDPLPGVGTTARRPAISFGAYTNFA